MRKRAGDGRLGQCGCPLPSEEGKDCYLREEAISDPDCRVCAMFARQGSDCVSVSGGADIGLVYGVVCRVQGVG